MRRRPGSAVCALLLSSFVIVGMPSRIIADPTVVPSPKEWPDLMNRNGVEPSKRRIYGIEVGSIGVRNTRSPHNDTIHMTLTVTVNGESAKPVIWDPALNCSNCDHGRNFNNGLYFFRNFEVGLIRLRPTDKVGIVVNVFNAGHIDGIDQKLLNLAGVLINYFCYSIGDCELINQVYGLVKDLIDPDCDGPVALTSFMMTGSEVMSQGADPARPSLINIPGTADNTFIGADNPGDHCGTNSNYIVNLYAFSIVW